MWIRLAAVVKGIQICHAAGRQHTLELIPEQIKAGRHDALESLVLAQHQPVYVQLGADQLCQHLRLQ